MGKTTELVSKFFGRRGSPRLSPEDYVGKLESRGLGPDGRQVPDPDPMQPPIGYKKQPSMVDIIREQVRQHVDHYAQMTDHETFEESEDFDFEEEPEMRSGYENETDPPLEELLRAGREALAEKEKSGGGGGTPPPPVPSPLTPQAAPAKPQSGPGDGPETKG